MSGLQLRDYAGADVAAVAAVSVDRASAESTADVSTGTGWSVLVRLVGFLLVLPAVLMFVVRFVFG